jgi:nucleoid-associated protein YgaU
MPPTSGQLEKATLRVVEGDAAQTSLRFTYNPREFSTSKSSSWNRPTTSGARSSTRPQFAGAGPQSLSMEILLDAWEDRAADVVASVQTLFEWLKPTPGSIQRRSPSPPVLSFEWGSSRALADFRGYLKQVTAKYTVFKPDGTPLRATCTIQLEEIPQEPAGQNPTSGAREGRWSRTLAEGDSLQSVAWREYGNAALWRGLASFNRIDDPFRLPPGTQILVPTATEALRLAEGGD